MKIYSWNILYRNQELDAAFRFIAESDFDIFCLQEVPGEFLKRLQTLPCFIAYRTDVERIFENDIIHNYVVILSKHPIETHAEIPFPDYWPLLPFRMRIFVRLMRPFGFSKIRNRGGIFANIRIPGLASTIRVFNLHLILANPAWRLEEFERAMLKRDPARPTVVCGDFNVLERPHIVLLNWLLGGRVTDTLLYTRERTHIEKRFVEHRLVNVLRGKITHSLSQSQLDHILLSHHLIVQDSTVISDKHGSDHHPILVKTSDPVPRSGGA